MTKTREDYGSGIARLKFEPKGQFLKELRDNTFSGSENGDANEHTERVLEIVELSTTLVVTRDQLMLRVFPISLTGAASTWLRNEPTVSITTWEILKGKFLSKYCPPSRTAKRMEEINNFQQEPDETFYQAWERFKELLLRCVPTMKVDDAKKVIQEMADYSQKWHNGTSTRNKSSNTSDGLAAIQAQLNNLGREIKKVNERVYAARVGCKLCDGPHYSKDCSLKEEGKTLEEAYYTQFGANDGESLSKFMAESEKRHDENSSLNKEIRASTDAAIRNQRASIKALEIQIKQISKVLQERGSGSLLSSAETNLRDHVKSITTTDEADTPSIRRIEPTQYGVSSQRNDDKMQLIKLSRASVPFPGRLKEYGYDKEDVLKGLQKLQVNLAESATSLKRLLKEKTRIEEEIKASMNEHYSAIITDDLPSKEKEPWSFNDICFDKALDNLGASVSVMPCLTFTNIGLGKLAPTKLIIELADKTVKHPKGVLENVLVEIDKFVFLIDYIVLDIPEDIKIPLILGRPFLSTTHAKIDVFKRKIALRIRDDKILFKSDSPTSNIIKKVYVLGLRNRMELDLEVRLMVKALILNRSQDYEFGDFIELNDLNKPLELRNHEIEDLGPTIKEGEVIDEPMVDVVEIRNGDEILEKINEYLSFCDYDRKIHVNYTYNLQFN
nr:hypothetical protein [Tanacetum cinerariifolium]